MSVRARIFFMSVMFIAASFVARASYADCNSQLAPLFTAGGTHIHMTISTDNNRWVSYSDGFIPLAYGYLSGTVDQLFSDRFLTFPDSFIGQPFYIAAADRITPWIDGNGHVWLYNNTWGGWSDFQGTCSNGFLYGFVGGVMVSFSMTPWTPVVPH
jgi:hypothetical protein